MNKKVGKTTAMKPMQCSHSLRPLLGQLKPFPAEYVVSGPSGVFGAHFEAGRKDDAIHFKLFAVRNDTPLGNRMNAFSFSVDQMNVLSVESRQVIVVKTRPFTKLPVPGL